MLNKPDNLFEATRSLEEAFWFLWTRAQDIEAYMPEWLFCNWYYGWC